MYSRISGARDGRGSIRYAEGSAHDGSGHRNLLVFPVNMIPNGRYADQMEPLWRKARKNHRIQTRRIVISFSKKELDPYSVQDIDTAKVIATEFIRTYYPDRQAVLYFQRDGKGGCLHCHAIVNDISLTDHKGCTRTQQFYKYVRNGIDTVASKYITLDDGGRTESKQTRTERVKAEKAAKLMEEHPELQGADLRNALIKEKAYSYKEDMKQRIHEAALKSSDEKEFFKKLRGEGIDVTTKTTPKYGEHYVYDFTMCPVGVKNTKARSYKLGYSYCPEAVRMIWQEKAKNGQPEKAKDNAFATWLHEQEQSIFEYGADGRLTDTNFDLMDRLHEEYLQAETTALADMSQMADQIKHRQRKIRATARKRVKQAEDNLTSNIKKKDRQHEYTL